jgi:hypothetical protein
VELAHLGAEVVKGPQPQISQIAQIESAEGASGVRSPRIMQIVARFVF